MKAAWEFLNSLKLTVYLVLAITAVTMAGSMVLYFRPEIFGDMDQSLLFPWMMTKGLAHPGLTWWLFLLVFLVVLLGFNTFVCTVERLPKLIRRYRDPLLNIREMEVGGGEGRLVSFDTTPAESLSGALRKNGYKVFVKDRSLFAEKNRWAPFMPYAVHIGVMVFMVGHMISGLTGYRNTGLLIHEGEVRKSPAGDYSLRVEKVKVDMRPDGSLKDFGSLITAIKDDKVIKEGWVTANSPMFVEGGAVYQREFGQDFRGLILTMSDRASGVNRPEFISKETGYVEPQGTNFKVVVENFVADFAVEPGGAVYSRSEEMENPAVMVNVSRGGKPVGKGWLIMHDPGNNTLVAGDTTFSFAGLDIKPYSTFDVNRDPSALIALVASMIVMFGTVIALYFRRERVWAVIDEEGGRAQVLCSDDDLYETCGWS